MKFSKIVLLVIALLLLTVFPAYAQLGDEDISTFTIMNISGGNAEVSVMFVAENGSQISPDPLSGGLSNPFTMADGEVKQIVVHQIPSLPSGRYSVVISSDAEIVAQAGVAGTGTTRFSGAYSGFSSGSTTVYIPSVAYNFGNPAWYSMISAQNISSNSTNIQMTITCSNGTTGTMSANNVPGYASHTWVLKNEVPSGFTNSTVCEGSAIIEASQPIIAVNNQNIPATGATNTFEGSAQGSSTLYAANLSNNFSGWKSALTIRKLNSGSTTVTVDYGGSWSNSTCNLTDAVPSCKLIMATEHGGDTGRNGAKITSSNGNPLLALVGSTKNSLLSNGVNAFASGSKVVDAPNVTKYFFGYISAITCVNVSSVQTSINVNYQGYGGNNYNTASLNEGESVQILVYQESFLPDGFQGGATLTANASNGVIACQIGNTKTQLSAGDPNGDWTVAFPGFGR